VRVPRHVIDARRERLAQMIERHRYLPLRELCRLLGVSEATARRDLTALAGEKRITRTYGGALSEFNDRFPSFRERITHGARAKARIARAARALIEPGGTYYLDSGTTIYALAEALREEPIGPITVVTCNIPVGEVLSALPGVEVYHVAGQLLPRQSVLLGETARRSLEFWRFDAVFLSAEGMNAEGIWNSQQAIVEQQRTAMRQARRSVFCIDGSKLGRVAPHFLCAWPEMDLLLTEVPLVKLQKAGLRLSERNCPGVTVTAGKEAGAAAEEERGPEQLPVHFL
jgi:DeoR/GlpR family transcriptional regulator of sugar metabolism